MTRPTSQHRRNLVTRDSHDTVLHRTTVFADHSSERRQPSTWADETRSFEAVLATEDVATVRDPYRREIVDEVLLMRGCQLPANRQVPYLNNHNRQLMRDQLGSIRNLRVEGSQLLCQPHHADTPEGQAAAALVRDGHATHLSAGYHVDPNRTVYVRPGQSATLEGRTYTARARTLAIRQWWQLKEGSLVVIPADSNAQARSADQPPNHRTPHSMKDALRKLLIRLGLAQDATDDQAWEFLGQHLDNEEVRAAFAEHQVQRNAPQHPDGHAGGAAQQSQTTDDGGGQGSEPIQLTRADLSAMIGQAVQTAIGEHVPTLTRAEQSRREQISGIGRQMSIDEAVVQRSLDQGHSVEQAQAAFFQAIMKRAETQAQPIYVPHVQVTRDGADSFRAAGLDGLLLRSGIVIEKPAAGAEELAGFSCRELARECLRRSGEVTPRDVREMVGRAMTTSDFPYILENLGRKMLHEGYENAPETWMQWVDTGGVSDYKQHSEVRAGEFSDLDELGEAEEYKYGKRSEQKETYQVAKYGKLLMFTREMAINDDLDGFRDNAQRMGEAARRKEGDCVYAVLTANAAMGDGNALFIAAHSNLAAGDDVGSVANKLGIGVKAMKTQTDIDGLQRLNIRPTYLIGPVAIEESTEQHFGAYQPTASTGVNVFRGYFGADNRVYEARLDDNSTTGWYLAGPKGKTIRLRFLLNQRTPYSERTEEFRRDAVALKVRHEIVAHARDWRALYYNPGA